jgi:hypothetical protein
MKFRVLLIMQYLIREILVEAVLDVHVRGVRIKKIINSDVVTMHILQKRLIEKYMCWYTYGELFVPHDTMARGMVGSTSCITNLHRVVDDNSNSYRNMVMNTI